MEIVPTELESMEAKVKEVRLTVGCDIPESEVLKALSQSENDVRAAIDLIVDSSSAYSSAPHLTARKTLTSTGGARISTFQVNLSNDIKVGVEDSDGFNVVIPDSLSVENGEVAVVLDKEVLKKCRMDVGLEESVKVKEESSVGVLKGGVNGEGNKTLGDEMLLRLEGVSRFSLEEGLGLNNTEDKIEEDSGVLEGEREGVISKGCEISDGSIGAVKVKLECDVVLGGDNKDQNCEKPVGKVGRSGLSLEEWLALNHPEKKEEEKSRVKEETDMDIETSSVVKQEAICVGSVGVELKESMKVKKECDVGPVEENKRSNDERALVLAEKRDLSYEESKSETQKSQAIAVKKETNEVITAQPLSARKLSGDDYRKIMGPYNNKPKKKKVEETTLSCLVLEDGDFPEEPDWFLVGRTVVTGLSTTKGRKLENNEIVHFTFPSPAVRRNTSTYYASAKSVNAAASIVRFSTKRSGEVYLST